MLHIPPTEAERSSLDLQENSEDKQLMPEQSVGHDSCVRSSSASQTKEAKNDLENHCSGALGMAVTTLPAQTKTAAPSFAWMGEEMLRSTPSLVQVALSSHFFLDLGAELDLSEEQQARLQQIDFKDLTELIQKKAELMLAGSELNVLLSRPEVNLAAVKAVLTKRGELQSELEMLRIRRALEAVDAINHAQHRRAIVLGRKTAENR